MAEKELSKEKLLQAYLGVCEEMHELVEALKVCRYCKNMGKDCTPSGHECEPEWRGY